MRRSTYSIGNTAGDGACNRQGGVGGDGASAGVTMGAYATGYTTGDGVYNG